MVGPPSEELNCFGAMKLRIQWPEAESPPLRVRIPHRWGSGGIRQEHWLPGRFKPCRLCDEQNHWSATCRLQPVARWP